MPMPDGSLSRFEFEHSLVVEPGLLKKYPELGATYRGRGIDDPTATVRFDFLSGGFHAMVLSANGTVMIDPYSKSDTENYVTYFKGELPDAAKFKCEVGDRSFGSLLNDSLTDAESVLPGYAPEVVSGTQLRTYRLALAADNEYAVAAGGNTIAGTLAAQVLIMNRVNGVYERDLGIVEPSEGCGQEAGHGNVVAVQDRDDLGAFDVVGRLFAGHERQRVVHVPGLRVFVSLPAHVSRAEFSTHVLDPRSVSVVEYPGLVCGFDRAGRRDRRHDDLGRFVVRGDEDRRLERLGVRTDGCGNVAIDAPQRDGLQDEAEHRQCLERDQCERDAAVPTPCGKRERQAPREVGQERPDGNDATGASQEFLSARFGLGSGHLRGPGRDGSRRLPHAHAPRIDTGPGRVEPVEVGITRGERGWRRPRSSRLWGCGGHGRR